MRNVGLPSLHFIDTLTVRDLRDFLKNRAKEIWIWEDSCPHFNLDVVETPVPIPNKIYKSPLSLSPPTKL